MTRGKAIAAALAGAAGLLGVLAVAQLSGLGTGYSLATEAGADAPTGRVATLDRSPIAMRPWSEYGEILSRPLFNESRAPEESEPTGPGPEAQASALNVVLTGVVLTNDLRIAIVKDNESGKSTRVKLGQPLEGGQAGWTLAELKPRGAVFDGGQLGRQELELTVDTKGAPAPAVPPPAQPAQPNQTTAMAPVTPPPAPPNQPPGAAPAVPGDNTQPQAATAEDIRRRIEERRRQLREEAQRMLEQGQNEKQQ
jgi:general secretion pathway protein N